MPRGLTTEIKAAIAAGTVYPVYLAYFDFDGYALRTWTGEGDLSYDSETWSGDGYLQALPTIAESANLYAESVTLQLTGKPDTAVDLSDPAKYQGRAVAVYVGFYAADGTLPSTNIYKLFSGTMSQVEFSSDAQDESWVVTAESRLVDLQRVKSALSTHEEQRSRYPDDNGYAYESRARTAVALFRDQDIPGPSSRRIIYGQRRVPARIVFAGTSGSGSRYLNLVIEVADHECQSVEQVYIDERALLSGGVVAGEFVGFVDYYVKLGTADQTYIAELETEVGSSIWDSDCRLRGVCYVYLRLLSSDPLFGDTLPTIEIEVKGKKLYDPRTDTTAYSTNAALALRDYLLAESGFGAAASELDEDAFETAADVCDEAVDRADATSEPRYRASGVIDSSQPIGDNLQILLQACAGVLTYVGGEFVLLAGEYVAPDLTITEADLLGREVVSNLNRRSWSNGAKGVYVSADKNWSEENYPSYINAGHVASDGESRNLIHDLPLTTSPAAAQRLAKLAVNDTRRSRGLSLLCRLSFFDLICGDVVNVTLERLGYVDKTFRVEALRLQADGLQLGIALDLREIASTHYAWDESTEEIELETFTDPTDVLENWVNAKLAPPSGTPTSQSFSSTFNVTVSHNESGATCYYTLDGSEPTEADSSVADGGTVSIVHDNEDVVLKLKTFEDAGDLESDVVTYTYTAILTAPAPDFVNQTVGAPPDAVWNLVWSADSETDDGTPTTLQTRDSGGSSPDNNWSSSINTWVISDRETGTTGWPNNYDDYEARVTAAGHLTAIGADPKQMPQPYLHTIYLSSNPYVRPALWYIGTGNLAVRSRERADSPGSSWGSWSSWSTSTIINGTSGNYENLYNQPYTITAGSTTWPLTKSSGTVLVQYEMKYIKSGWADSESASIEGEES